MLQASQLSAAIMLRAAATMLGLTWTLTCSCDNAAHALCATISRCSSAVGHIQAAATGLQDRKLLRIRWNIRCSSALQAAATMHQRSYNHLNDAVGLTIGSCSDAACSCNDAAYSLEHHTHLRKCYTQRVCRSKNLSNISAAGFGTAQRQQNRPASRSWSICSSRGCLS